MHGPWIIMRVLQNNDHSDLLTKTVNISQGTGTNSDSNYFDHYNFKDLIIHVKHCTLITVIWLLL